MDNTQLLLTLLVLPLCSAAFIACFLRRSKWGGALVSTTVGFVLMALALVFFFKWDGATIQQSWQWLRLGDISLSLGILVDANAALMLLVVTFVAAWIQLFSVGYMDDDPAKGRFFAGLSLFMFSIIGIAIADNLVMLFIFWELVGFCSYMLIAHYFTQPDANMASKKAFIVNRVGDLGFLIGIVWCYHLYGTVQISELAALIEADPSKMVTGLGLCLMCGFLGKSAQFPLQVWLTDAMAGPTPVSALIHAATMVAAGIYFLARIFFMFTPFVLDWIIWSGALMALLAGIWALGQKDIKKSLAYSTLSHLGYMACAVGLGMPALALFHMAMHAVFKATLFLGSGSVIHACHHEQDIFKMGGLFKKMPITGITFLISGLSAAAVPFFAGHYSKDAIISQAWNVNGVVFGMLLLAAVFTAVYVTRLFAVAFLGKPRGEGAEHAHESGFAMTLPLVILGALSLGAGWIVYGWPLLPQVCADAIMPAYHAFHGSLVEASLASPLLIASIVAALVGFAWGILYYGKSREDDPLKQKHPKLYHAIHQHGWFDVVYDWYVAKVQQRVCDVLAFADMLVSGLLMMRGSATVVAAVGLLARISVTGNVRVYLYWFFAGMLVFMAFLFKFLF